MTRYALLFGLPLIVACGTITQPCPPPAHHIIYVTEEGWHVSIGIPSEELGDQLKFYKTIFKDANVIEFGYGKRTFFTAPPDTLSEYILGPVPGPAAIQVFALNVTPLEAYPPEDTLILKVTPDEQAALSDFIWNDLDKDNHSIPYVIAPSHNPEGLFYAARSEYNPLHTCNTWATDALQSAGLNISSDWVIFSGQAMGRVQDTAQSQCALNF